jgi:hypothetical protein
MRKRTVWRLSPNEAEENYCRAQAKKEGRELSQMLHVLLSEAILARQASEHQARKVCELTALLRGEHAEGTQS